MDLEKTRLRVVVDGFFVLVGILVDKAEDILEGTTKGSKGFSELEEFETLTSKKSLEEVPHFTRILGNGHTLDEMAEVYAKNVHSNKKWRWLDNFPVGELITGKEQDAIRELAIEKGLIPKVPVRTVTNTTGGT